jgi:hypothetical protein
VTVEARRSSSIAAAVELISTELGEVYVCGVRRSLVEERHWSSLEQGRGFMYTDGGRSRNTVNT